MTLSHFEQPVGHWRRPDAGPREARDHRGEIVSTIEAVLEFGEVARRVLAADGPIGAGDRRLDVAESRVDPLESGCVRCGGSAPCDDDLMGTPCRGDAAEAAQAVAEHSAVRFEAGCANHAIMSADAWRGVYRDAWTRYYSDAHVETVLRRAVKSGINPRKIVDAIDGVLGSSRIERVHPLQFGCVRRKLRTQRRHGLPVVNPLVFYPWRAFDFLSVAGKSGGARALATARSCAACSPTRTARLTWTRRSSPPTEVDHIATTISSPAMPTRSPSTYGAPKREREHATAAG